MKLHFTAGTSYLGSHWRSIYIDKNRPNNGRGRAGGHSRASNQGGEGGKSELFAQAGFHFYLSMVMKKFQEVFQH